MSSLITSDFMQPSLKMFFITSFVDSSIQSYARTFEPFWEQNLRNILILNLSSCKITHYSLVRQENNLKFAAVLRAKGFPSIHPHVAISQFEQFPYNFIKDGKLRGVEGHIIDEFFEKPNFNYTIINQKKLISLNQVWSILKQSDILLHPVHFTNETKLIMNIHLNEMDGMCMLVPVNIRVSATNNLSIPSKTIFLVIFVLVIFLLIAVWKLTSSYDRSKFSLAYIIFAVYQLIIGLGFNNEYRLSRKEKLLIYTFMTCNMFLIQLYQSWILAIMLTKPSMRAVQSLKELNESDTKISQFYFESFIKFRKELVVEMVSVLDHVSYSTLENFDKKLAYAVSCRYADFFVSSPSNFDGKIKKFEKMSKPIYTYSLAYLISKNFLYKDALKFKVDAILESGLKNYWVKEILEKKKYKQKNPEHVDTLTQDIKFPLLVLGFGGGLGVIAFAFEHLIYQFKQMRRKAKLKRLKLILRRNRRAAMRRRLNI